MTGPGRVWCDLVEDGKAKSSILVLDDLDLIHGIDDKVCSMRINLVPGVRGADSNDDRTGSDTCLDSRWRVFKDDTSFWVQSEIGCGEEEWVGVWFSPLESWVVGCDANFGDGDTRSVQTTVTIRLGT